MYKINQVIELIENNQANLEFLPTGFPKLDDALDGGFLRKELVIIGGNTGIGKSYFSGQLLWNIAQKGFKTGYFSLEISNEMVVSRLLGALANLKSTRIRSGNLTTEEVALKQEAIARALVYQDFMTFYDEDYELTKIAQEIKTQGFEFIVVDFIQNIIAKGNDEYSRLSLVALELQKLAKETNSCILVLSQLSNRASREGATGMVEYKGAGTIAQVCDLGFWIERSDYAVEGTDHNLIKLNLRKNRRGISSIQFDYKFRSPGGYLFEA